MTDAATVEAVAFNITWHNALDIRAESDAYLCERPLRNYRHWLIEKGLDQVLFRSLTDQLIKVVGTETSKQRLDSTVIQSAVRGLTRLGIIVESISKFLRELCRFHPALHAQVRIRGRAAVSYASFLRALGLNIYRVAAYKAALA